MKGNKKILYVLGAALASVWGAIAYQLIDAVAANDAKGPEIVHLRQNMNSTARRHPYVEDVKDPFEYFKPRPEKKRPNLRIPLIQQVFVPPPFTLTGIVTSDSRQMAVLQAKDGSVQFLSEGDSTAGLRILAITRKEVTYRYMNQEKTWKLSD